MNFQYSQEICHFCSNSLHIKSDSRGIVEAYCPDNDCSDRFAYKIIITSSSFITFLIDNYFIEIIINFKIPCTMHIENVYTRDSVMIEQILELNESNIDYQFHRLKKLQLFV